MSGIGSYVVGNGDSSSRTGCLGYAAALQAVRLESLEEARCWVATVAHDFNNLLAAIGLNCDRIASEATNANQVRDLVERIRSLQQFARGQVKHLLLLARAAPESRADTRLSEVIREMLPLLEQLCGKTRLCVRLDPRVGEVEMSAGGLRQVILNLVLNARDAVAHNGRIGIEAFRCRSTRGARGARVGLRVWDNGKGMDPAARRGIQRAFFSSKDGPTRGWGLFTVRRVVAEAGGEVRIESHASKGTRFTVFLPVRQLRSRASSQPVAASAFQEGTRRAGLIDKVTE